MPPRKPKSPTPDLTRFTYDDITDPRTPETGHTSLLPDEDLTVTLPMDNGWVEGMQVASLPATDGNQDRTVLVDMDWRVDPVLFWAGKRSRKTIPVLPLQRNEIVTESRIGQIIERARRRAEAANPQRDLEQQATLFDFSDLEKKLREGDRDRRVDFYTHEEGWKNKLICGDSLHVMESLIHYEGLRGKVQMIYFDPPYGIDYNTNIQQRVDSTVVDEADRADDVIAIRAFRDTWSLGVHSYLSYLQERLYLCRELLRDGGSLFLQISDINLHLVRTVLDEVFGKSNFVSQILFRKTGGLSSKFLNGVGDYLLWYTNDKDLLRQHYNQLYRRKSPGDEGATQYHYRLNDDFTVSELALDDMVGLSPEEIIAHDNITSQGNPMYTYEFAGRRFTGPFKPPPHRMPLLEKAGRLCIVGNTLRYVRRLSDFSWFEINQLWEDTGVSGFGRRKTYVVQTSELVVARCILMTTRPGDLVLDPTLGSGTTALTAERYGRRWIGIDSSRVAINVARKELLSSVFPAYQLRAVTPSSGMYYEEAERTTMSSIIDNLEPEKVPLLDQPLFESGILRVIGPFEVTTLGRYSPDDWKGYVRESGTLENYIHVVSRLYRKDAEGQAASGLVHAISQPEGDKPIAISVGPLNGRVTAKQISDVVQDALSLGILSVHVLGWAFEANVGEIKTQIESRGRVKVELVMIRPDTLAEGLKVTDAAGLFSPLSLPDISILKVTPLSPTPESQHLAPAPEYAVTLNGVGLFDRKTRTTNYKQADSGYVAAWYLDEDYDGDCFVDSQMFFDFSKTPSLSASLKAHIEPDEFTLKLTSLPFAPGHYRRIAVKVVDVYGNESTVVKELPE